MIDFFSRNRGPISLLIGGLGLFILALILATRAVRRAGGWKVVFRRAGRELRLTGAAFVRPFRLWLRYRLSLRRLTRALADPATRADADRALRAASGGPAQPYAVLVGPTSTAVLLAGRDPGTPPEPFAPDEHDPRLWWAERADLPEPDGGDPLPVALGMTAKDLVVYLDLHTGPRLTAGAGDPRTTRALIQAIAAQLGLVLPAGAVQVTAGVHPRFPGTEPTADAAFVVCPEPPAEPVAARVLAVGGARGQARLLRTERGGVVRIAGVPLTIETAALPRAVARLLKSEPQEVQPRPVEKAPEVPVVQEFMPEEPETVTGVSANTATVAIVEPPNDFDEPEFDDAAVGRRAGGTA
ncbi:hypothetical protein [Dactylosporangium sp. CS-033363]|uniref:hypothetical protein n=1 Tax=Dactylosporangium sp. CS-033363 TaxID=3239935 RepID=UPI003D94A79A